jgi:hypothetical protein
MAKRKTFREKLLDAKGLPETGRVPERMIASWGGETLVVPAPIEVDALMRQVPPGRVTTINEIRKALARKHQVDVTCPITTGIFASIAAHSACEEAAQGAIDTNPYWRTLKAGGELNPKYPGGVEALRAHLEEEGLSIRTRGNRAFVEGYEGALWSEFAD